MPCRADESAHQCQWQPQHQEYVTEITCQPLIPQHESGMLCSAAPNAHRWRRQPQHQGRTGRAADASSARHGGGGGSDRGGEVVA